MAAGLPTSTLVEVQLNSVWTDITAYVGSWSVRRGGRQPGTLNLDLDNADGRFMPDNATSAYFPHFVEGAAVRVTVTKSAASSVRFFGWLSEIVPSYPSEPSHSRVAVTAVDALGVFARTELQPYPRRGVEPLSSCVAYYPLTEKNARGGGGDTKGNLRDLVVRVVSTDGSLDFASDDSFSTDTEPCVSMTSGRGLWHSASAFSSSTDRLVIDGLFKLPASSSGTVLSVLAGGSVAAFVSWSHTAGELTVSTGGIGTSASTAPGEWHRLSLVRNGFGEADLYVDGVFRTSDSGWGSTGTRLAIGGDITLSVRDVSIFTTDVDPTTFDYTRQVGIAANTLGGAASVRSDLGFTFTTDPTTVPATGTAAGGRTQFDAMLAAADSEAGVVYCTYTSSSASPVALANVNSRPATVALTIDAEADMTGDPELVRGLAEIVGEVTVSSPVGDVRVIDGTGAFGATDATVDTFLSDPVYRLAKAQDVLAQSNNARLRLTSVTLDLVTAANNRYAAFFDTTPGERVRLTGLPSAYFGVTYIDGFADGWEERGSPSRYEVTFDLSPADAPPEGLWDDSTYGRWGFGDGVATNVSSATSSATSVQFQWTGGLTLSTSAGDYPLDLDWNGERITVNSAPTGGSSPQTLSITRGVAPTVARAHNAGESVDIWNAARWAM